MNRHLTPTRRRVRTVLCRLTTLAWAALVFHLSTETYGSSLTAWMLGEILLFLHLTVTPNTFSTLHNLLRKSAHLTEYAIFALLLYGCFANGEKIEWRARTAFWSILAAGMYSLTDEFHQSFVPGRTASFIDCGIDTMGAALAMLGIYGGEWLFAAGSEASAAKSGGPTETKSGLAEL